MSPFRGARPLVLALVVAALTLWWMRSAPARAIAFTRGADQNVLLITIDTLRADALGIYGGRAATPHLDNLARDGARFTFAHAHSVVTLPSHTNILTGRYPFDHGVRDNGGYRATDDLETIAELAQRAGRPTGAFVGGFPLDRRFGLAQGFDKYDDVGGRGVAENDFSFSERPANEVVASARTWIDAQSSPWLAWVHVFDPHAPYRPPPPYDTPANGGPYAGEVAFVDQAIGPLLDALRASPRTTTVIVTSDHGEGLGEHGEATHGTFAYETTLRVPLILSQVGGAHAAGRGAVFDRPVRHVDIVPTIADLIGLPVNPQWPGRSLAAAGATDDEVQAAYFEAMTPMLTRGWAPLSGVILGTRKYIDVPVEELYDLRADPVEARNLASERVTDRDLLRARLSAFGAARPGAAPRAENAEARARLESLGYVAHSAPQKTRFTEQDDPKRLIRLDQLMLDGIAQYQEGRVAEAVRTYQHVIAERPDMSLAVLRLAFMQWEAGAVGPAIDTLRAAAARQPGPERDSEIDVRLATYLADTGGVAEATRMLERVVAGDPRNSGALNSLGIAYARSGRINDALRTFTRILSTDPRDVQALENIGTVQLQRKAWPEAETAFKAVLAIAPRASRAHAGLGVIALERGQRDAAISHWQDAVAMDPRNFDALFNLATELVNANRFAEARPLLERFVRTAPRAFYGPDIDRLRALLERR